MLDKTNVMTLKTKMFSDIGAEVTALMAFCMSCVNAKFCCWLRQSG
jgi:hypothetical protein